MSAGSVMAHLLLQAVPADPANGFHVSWAMAQWIVTSFAALISIITGKAYSELKEADKSTRKELDEAKAALSRLGSGISACQTRHQELSVTKAEFKELKREISVLYESIQGREGLRSEIVSLNTQMREVLRWMHKSTDMPTDE